MRKINREQHPMPTQIFSHYSTFVVWALEVEVPLISEEKWSSMKKSQLEKYMYNWLERRQVQKEKHKDELLKQERTFKPQWLS